MPSPIITIFYFFAILPLIPAAILFTLFVSKEALSLADKSRELLKAFALDAVQIWASGRAAKLDHDREQSKLTYSEDLALLRLAEYRNARLKGGKE